MKFIEVINIETSNTVLINIDNVAAVTKIWGGWYNDKHQDYKNEPYHGCVDFLYGGGHIRISAEDYERIRHL